MAGKKKNLDAQFKAIADEALDAAESVECDLQEFVWGLACIKAAIEQRFIDAKDELDGLLP